MRGARGCRVHDGHDRRRGTARGDAGGGGGRAACGGRPVERRRAGRDGSSYGSFTGLSARMSTTAPGTTARGTMKHAKILIADDEAAITTGLSAILEDAGYSV